MNELKSKITTLESEVKTAAERIGLSKLEQELKDLQKKSEVADFWQNNISAQATMKSLADMTARVEPWRALQKNVSELGELAGLDDTKLQPEINDQLAQLQADFRALKTQLKLAGPHDNHNVILSIYSGAGGTDAQDWAEMLQRMYTRFAAKTGFKVSLIDQSPGDGAGIKNATLEVDGPFAYGRLKSEHGVHRLVRLSPYNADNLRQTSFAKVEILPKIDRPEALELDEKDLKIDVYRAGGHGGQSVNTTDSAVRITHIPTGLTVAIQNERSQLQNRETALTILRSKLAQLQIEQHQEKISELKGPNQSAEWGNQIRSYVLHPYKQVKDLRTKYETSEVQKVLDGDLEPIINAYLEHSLSA